MKLALYQKLKEYYNQRIWVLMMGTLLVLSVERNLTGEEITFIGMISNN